MSTTIFLFICGCVLSLCVILLSRALDKERDENYNLRMRNEALRGSLSDLIDLNSKTFMKYLDVKRELEELKKQQETEIYFIKTFG